MMLLTALGLSCALGAADGLLPDDHPYNTAVPEPAAVLGHAIGEWHVRPDQLLAAAQALADTSPRVRVEEIGRSHERQAQITLFISSPENISRLEELRARHLAGEADAPLVLWFGYSIHGNEASGSNAAVAFAYFLAASEDPKLKALLEDTIVLIDPSLNPDGLGRFSRWVNSHRSTSAPVAARINREHQEVWPGGRFNHYWFDLNRDWVPLVHPESRARVAFQQRWKPHVITDFHEMGSDQSYFFQPGVPNRRHPLTPEANVSLTARLAQWHARGLDEVGQAYFTEERFDDFYYGKGSTYPDAQGSIGILFEQASPRGHLMATRRGPLSLRTAVRNQLVTSFSTLNGATDMAQDLKDYRRDFAAATRELAADDAIKAYVFGDDGDPYRAQVLLNNLTQHQIEVYELAESVTVDGVRFAPGSAWIVPAAQNQYRLLKSLFEIRTEFDDNAFYDVSSWHLPSAFNLPYAALRRTGNLRGEAWSPTGAADDVPATDAVAFAIRWGDYGAAATLARLHAAEIPVTGALRAFSAPTPDGVEDFAAGTLVIEGKDGGKAREALAPGVTMIPLTSGLTPSGPDLGSPSIAPLRPVKPLLLVGRGVDPQSAGDAWHLLDTRVGLPPVMVEPHQLMSLPLNRYTHFLMVGGEYENLPAEFVERLRPWIASGGVLVASQQAAVWVAEHGLNLPEAPAESDKAKKEKKSATPTRAYGDFDRDFADTVLGGVVVNTDVDLSHPLAFGLKRPELPLLRRGTTVLAVDKNPYATPLRYAEDPLITGFIGDARREQLGGSAAVIANRIGEGVVIRLADNPNFRGFWYGGNRLYFNALFYAREITATPVPDTETRR